MLNTPLARTYTIKHIKQTFTQASIFFYSFYTTFCIFFSFFLVFFIHFFYFIFLYSFFSQLFVYFFFYVYEEGSNFLQHYQENNSVAIFPFNNL